jgi:cytochrome c oxidase subunit 3
MYMHSYNGGGSVLAFGLAMVLYSMCVWWRDVVRESTYQGHHTLAVQVGLRYGMILFIVSELMFFLAFFWAFFHSSLAPTVEIGAVWPPKGIQVLNPWEIPFLNTIILLSSGASVTWAHHAILAGFRQQGIIALTITIVLALISLVFKDTSTWKRRLPYQMECMDLPFT